MPPLLPGHSPRTGHGKERKTLASSEQYGGSTIATKDCSPLTPSPQGCKLQGAVETVESRDSPGSKAELRTHKEESPDHFGGAQPGTRESAQAPASVCTDCEITNEPMLLVTVAHTLPGAPKVTQPQVSQPALTYCSGRQIQCLVQLGFCSAWTSFANGLM